MSMQLINGIWSYVDDGLNATFGNPPINNMSSQQQSTANTSTTNTSTTNTSTTNTSTTNTSTTNRLISENLAPGRNRFYESKKHLIADRPNGYTLNGKNSYFSKIEKGEEFDNTTVYNALLVEFASFSGRPKLLEGKLDIFQHFLDTLYKNITDTKEEFFKSAYKEALKMGYLGDVPSKEMVILYETETWHVYNVYCNKGSSLEYDTKFEDVVTYWLEPLYKTIGLGGYATSDSINTNPNNIAAPSAPTTAQNLSYRVGREDDNKNVIKSELLANLANLPEKPAQKIEPTSPTPTTSFTSYHIQGTRFITLPITSNYTLRLLNRFENEICSVPYNASQTRIELPINTLGSFYEIVPSKQRFYIHNGKGELLFEDATKHLDFSRLERFCMPLRDRKHAFVIMEHFLKDLSSYLLGTKKHFDSEIIKAIELFLYLFDRNKQRGNNYLECEMIDAIDRALADMVKG